MLAEFIKKWRESESMILSNVILDRVGPGLFRKFDPRISRTLAPIVLFFLFESFQLLAMLVARSPLELLFIPSLISSLITVLCILAVNWCYRYIIDQVEPVTDVLPDGESVKENFGAWFNTWTNRRVQLVTCFGTTVLFLGFLYAADRKVGLPFEFAYTDLSMIILFVAFWGAGQGLYWAFAAPLWAYELAKSNASDLSLNMLDPSRSLILMAFSRILAAYGILLGLLYSGALVLLFSLRPRFDIGVLFPIILIGIGYAFSFWIFLFSQYYFFKIIVDAKNTTLTRIHSEIEILFQRIGELDSKGSDQLNALVELNNLVDRTPNTLINLSTLPSFFTSLLLPTAATAINLLEEIQDYL